MQILAALLVGAIWWGLFGIAGFLEKKLPPRAFGALRWTMVLPAAVLAYLSAVFAIDLGVFFALIGYPAFIAAGMLVAPKRRFIPGIALLAVVLLVATYECKDNWDASNTRRWMSGGAGALLSGLVFYKMKDLEGD